MLLNRNTALPEHGAGFNPSRFRALSPEQTGMAFPLAEILFREVQGMFENNMGGGLPWNRCREISALC